MSKFRKKPVVIEAVQWFKNGDHPDDGTETFISPTDGKEYRCEGKVVRYYRHPFNSGEIICRQCNIRMHEHGWIDMREVEDGYVVCPGEWIITELNSRYYPCSPDIFKETYEEVV